jgi:hypothetical protein
MDVQWNDSRIKNNKNRDIKKSGFHQKNVPIATILSSSRSHNSPECLTFDLRCARVCTPPTRTRLWCRGRMTPPFCARNNWFGRSVCSVKNVFVFFTMCTLIQVYPIFITDQADAKEEIKAMPGQYRWGVNRLRECIAPLVAKGLKAVLIFGVLSNNEIKDNEGTIYYIIYIMYYFVEVFYLMY